MIADFHNHIIPAVDDGATDIESSRRGLQAFLGSGVSAVVTTPHFRGELTHDVAGSNERLDEIDRGWNALQQLAKSEFAAVRLDRGVELMLDVPDPELSDPRLRLAGTKFVLLEFPAMTVPPNAAAALEGISRQGYVPVVAHPERYAEIDRHLFLLEQWKGAGALLQINHGSVVGRYGAGPKRAAALLLQNGFASFLSSDYHSRGDTGINQSRAFFEAAGAREQFELLTDKNPRLLMEDKMPADVPPLKFENPVRRFISRVLAR